MVTRRLTAWCVCSLRQSTFQGCVQRRRSTLRYVACSLQPARQLVKPESLHTLLQNAEAEQARQVLREEVGRGAG